MLLLTHPSRLSVLPVKRLLAITICSLLVCEWALAQTFEIPGQSGQPTARSAARPGQKSSSTTDNQSSQGIGWGSSIEVGRLGRAAEQALARGNVTEAANFAERAVKAAPQSARLWFLLGYAARMAGRTQTSLDAYKRGLQLEPGSVEGLSGMAQTYMRMGRAADAKNLLMRVIAANPRRANDLAMAGELFVQTGDLQRGTQLLGRAEALRPSAHTEILLAVAYLKLKQPDRAKAVLERAKARAPRNPDVFRAVASFYRESRDYNAAIDALQKIPVKSPDILGELGYTYEMAGRKKEAAETYVKGANAAPKDIKLQLNAAASLIRVGDPEEARKYLATAQAIDANHYRLHAIRADLARTEKRLDQAIQEYNLAIANLPREGVPEGLLYPIQLRLNLAEMYRDAGDPANSNRQIQLAEAQINALNVEGSTRADFLRLRASVRAAGGNNAAAEADLKEALKADPDNINTKIQYAALLWRMKRPQDAEKIYQAALRQEPNNRFALESLGYLAREEGDNRTAEAFFNRLKKAYPSDYVAYVALGDLLTAQRRFKEAQQNYETAFKFAPSNALVVAGGANAAIEAHDLKLAQQWLSRAQGTMLDDPRVMKERQRLLFFEGRYLESAQLGSRVIQQLPRDRDATVYLAYDLYNLGRYDDALRLVREKGDVLPKEPNLPLLAGHVQKQAGLLSQAVDDYTHAIQLDPKMVEAYVNRGYVLNDMQDAEHAAEDFHRVLKLSPDNGVARLGLAFSYLQMRKGRLALEQVDAAERSLGESGSTHLARATAYRQMRLLHEAEQSYRAALKYAPNDVGLHLALADTLYHARRYRESVDVLNEALALSPESAGGIYAKAAHAYAQLRDRTQTLRYVQLAEREASEESGILLATGDALMLLGDESAAMDRFERALEAPDASRVDARLLIAKLFARRGKWDDARQQISLAFAESRIGEAPPVTTDNLIEAANLFTSMFEFDLAERYFERARDAGAADQVVAIGMANTYLAKGDHQRAEAMLASLGNPKEFERDYDYTMALANVYRERRESVRAMGLFARASQMSGEEEFAQQAMQDLAGEEGIRITPKVSVGSDLQVAPIFEDETIYMMDSLLLGLQSPPLPRSSLETRWTSDFRVHDGRLPTISGFFQVRNARGEISLPSVARVIERNTYDYVFNGALNPVLHFGRNWVAFNGGLALTFRRDKEDAFNINQNLFRQFLYFTTNTFWNWLQISGSGMHESGPYTQQDISSRDLVGRLEFRVGRPWGKSALVTGYSVRDLKFDPVVREFFQTSTYIGWERKWGENLRFRGIGEVIRAWRVQDSVWVNAQAIRPAAQIAWKPARRWTVDGEFSFSRAQGTTHIYDNIQGGLFISYVRPFRRSLDDGTGSVPIEYPLRFSVGVQHQNFFNFTGGGRSTFRPFVRLTFF